MINTIIADADRPRSNRWNVESLSGSLGDIARHADLAAALTHTQDVGLSAEQLDDLKRRADQNPAPVIGITGTGGSGKSSLTDELLIRLRADQGDRVNVAVLAVDPTRRGAHCRRCPSASPP